jgi:type III secretory pathway component EscU
MNGLLLLGAIWLLQLIAYLYTDHKKINKGRVKVFMLFFLINLFLPFLLAIMDGEPKQRPMCGPPMVELIVGVILAIVSVIIHGIYFVIDYLLKNNKTRSEK